MIDRIVNSALDSASPLLVRWRVIFFLLALVFMSPTFTQLYAPICYQLSISECWTKLVNTILSNTTWSAAVIAVSVFYIIPSFIYSVIRKTSTVSIKYAEPLIEELVKFRKKPNSEIEDIVATSFDEWKDRAHSAERDIEKQKDLCEVSVFSATFYTTTSIVLHVFNAPLAVALIVIACSLLYMSSRRILLIYLRDIAMFKALEGYIKYVILVKERSNN